MKKNFLEVFFFVGNNKDILKIGKVNLKNKVIIVFDN